MNKTSFYFLLCLLVMMVSSGCVETIIMDPHEENLPVAVTCVLEAGRSKQALYLQYVKGKSQEEYIPVENAKVYIKESSLLGKTFEFYHTSGCIWEIQESPFTVIVPDMTYTLYVEIPGRETITAETTIPSNRNIPQVVMYSRDRETETILDRYDDVYFQMNCEEGTKTAPVWIYAFKGKHTDNESAESRYPFLVTDHPNADPINITGEKFSSLVIEGGPGPDDFYLKSTWPVYKEMPQKMPNLPLYEGFVRIDHLDGSYFHLLAGPLKYRESYQDHFDFFFVSEEYDNYLRTIFIKNHRLDNNMTNVFSTENIYSNVKGGVGIFGGVSRNPIQFLI